MHPAAPLRTLLATGATVLALAGPGLPASAARAWRPPLAPPLVVLRPFEQPTGPYGPGHRGVDLAGREAAAVRAAGAGTVLVAGTVAGRPVVVVGHGPARTDDELRTTYEPVVAAVEVGARVEAGDPLGRLGTWPGHCDRSCLHWGLRRGGTYLDPMALLAGPVRLLPAGPPTPVPAPGLAGRAPPAGPPSFTATNRGAAVAGRGGAPVAPLVAAASGAVVVATLAVRRRRRRRRGGG